MDTGATDRMFPSSGCFLNNSIVSELYRISTARRGILHIVGIGDLNLFKLGTTKKVLHVLDF